jgi:glycosyltransferase involved in cell wall biosynthesis
MKVAILGSRGIPANYGGFETFAEELGARLSARGFDVTVYGRRHHVPERLASYRGCRLVAVPTVRTKALDTLVATALQVAHALREDYDAVLAVNAANAPLLLPLRLLRIRTLLNVDGIERLRAKWGALGRIWYALGEAFAVTVPDVVVADAGVIARYYESRHGAESVVIPYGSELAKPGGTETLRALGIAQRGYLLYVSRFEPENNPHRVAAEYSRLREARAGRGLDTPPLVMVGDAPYQREWIDSWKRAAPAGVLFPGFVYGEGYRELQWNSVVYVQATEVGGTHPALVEAMGTGTAILYNDTPENVEVAEGCGVPFSIRTHGSLAGALDRVLGDAALRERLGSAAAARARERYSWDGVAAAYAALLGG